MQQRKKNFTHKKGGSKKSGNTHSIIASNKGNKKKNHFDKKKHVPNKSRKNNDNNSNNNSNNKMKNNSMNGVKSLKRPRQEEDNKKNNNNNKKKKTTKTSSIDRHHQKSLDEQLFIDSDDEDFDQYDNNDSDSDLESVYSSDEDDHQVLPKAKDAENDDDENDVTMNHSESSDDDDDDDDDENLDLSDSKDNEDNEQEDEEVKNENCFNYYLSHDLIQALDGNHMVNEQVTSFKKPNVLQDQPILKQCLSMLCPPLTTTTEEKKNDNVSRRDIMVESREKSERTLCFLVPLIQSAMSTVSKQYQSVIVLSSESEAIELSENMQRICSSLTTADLNISLCLESQQGTEWDSSAQIVIGTPDGLSAASSSASSVLKSIRYMVMVDVDEWKDDNWLPSLATFIEVVQSGVKKYQTIFTSASCADSKQMNKIFDIVLTHFPLSHVKQQNTVVLNKQAQEYFMVKLESKLATLIQLLRENMDQKIVVFVSNKRSAQYYSIALDYLIPGLEVVESHSDLTQSIRTRNYFQFMNLKKGVLVCTDVATQDWKFSDVSFVVQYTAPESFAVYQQRARNIPRSILFLAEKVEDPLLKIYQAKQPRGTMELVNPISDPSAIVSAQKELNEFVQKDLELRELGVFVLRMEKNDFRIGLQRLPGMKSRVFIPLPFGQGIGLSRSHLSHYNFNDLQESKHHQYKFKKISRRSRDVVVKDEVPKKLSKRAIKKMEYEEKQKTK